MSSTQPIFAAVQAGDLDAAEGLLTRDRSLANARDAQGDTPLHHAARAGNLDLGWLLLRSGADVDGLSTGHQWRPIVHAAWEGKTEMVQLLIANGADVTRTGGNPIHYAGQRRRKEICKLLVEAGAVDDLVEPPSAEAVAVFRAAYSYDAAGLAARLREKPALAHLRDVEGRTPLHEAATNGDVESVGVLIRAGADLDARSDRGQTALDRAAAHRHADVVRVLMNAGASCDIFAAVRFGVAERLVKFLNTQPELVHARDAAGRTPLQIALMFGQKPAAKLLLDRGAEDPDGLGRQFLRGQSFRQTDLKGALFEEVDMRGAAFHNVSLRQAAFNDINLAGAHFHNVTLAGASIEEACIDGLTIWGVEIRPLVEAELEKRRRAAVGAGES